MMIKSYFDIEQFGYILYNYKHNLFYITIQTDIITIYFFEFITMLREQLIHSQTPKFSKHKKYMLTFIVIAFMALVLIFYLNSHYQNNTLQVPSKNITLVNWGRDIKNRVYPCPKRHKIAYIWTFGQMPEVYRDFVKRCKDNIIILDETDF